MGTEVSVLVVDRLFLSRMRFTAGDSLFFEWKDLGGNPIQLSFGAIVVLRDGAHPLSEGKQDSFGVIQQYGLLDHFGSDSSLVGREECLWYLVEK